MANEHSVFLGRGKRNPLTKKQLPFAEPVHADNPRGIRAYEKAGFRKEGRLRQEHFHDGRFHDTFIMGFLREEWKEDV
jgi:hypothetical protein